MDSPADQVVDLDSHTVKTADDLLKQIDDLSDPRTATGPGLGLMPGKLPESEIELAAEKLRQRFPFKSIRSRMEFQGPVDDQQLTKLGKKVISPSRPNSKSTPSKKAAKSVKVKTYDARHSRTIALDQLHSEKVAKFINSPGNGFFRIRTISPYDLQERKYAKHLQHDQVGSEVLGESIVALQKIKTKGSVYELNPAGMPSSDLMTQFNMVVAGGFGNRTGLVKGLDQVAGFEAHQTRLPEDWNGTLRRVDRKHYENLQGADVNWKANRIQLVSLLLHDEPQVYVSENLPNMEELSGTDVETRDLNDFEATALEKFKKRKTKVNATDSEEWLRALQGEEVISRATHNRILMMGSLRATENCLQCHAVNEGDLLGAFSYEFLRDPQSTPVKSEL